MAQPRRANKGVPKATIGLSVSRSVDFNKVGSAPQFAGAARWPESYAMLEPMSMHDLGCVKFRASHYHPPPGAGAPGLWHMVTSTLSGGDPTTRLSLRYFGWPSIDLPPASPQRALILLRDVMDGVHLWKAQGLCDLPSSTYRNIVLLNYDSAFSAWCSWGFENISDVWPSSAGLMR